MTLPLIQHRWIRIGFTLATVLFSGCSSAPPVNGRPEVCPLDSAFAQADRSFRMAFTAETPPPDLLDASTCGRDRPLREDPRRIALGRIGEDFDSLQTWYASPINRVDLLETARDSLECVLDLNARDDCESGEQDGEQAHFQDSTHHASPPQATDTPATDTLASFAPINLVAEESTRPFVDDIRREINLDRRNVITSIDTWIKNTLSPYFVGMEERLTRVSVAARDRADSAATAATRAEAAALRAEHAAVRSRIASTESEIATHRAARRAEYQARLLALYQRYLALRSSIVSFSEGGESVISLPQRPARYTVATWLGPTTRFEVLPSTHLLSLGLAAPIGVDVRLTDDRRMTEGSRCVLCAVRAVVSVVDVGPLTHYRVSSNPAILRSPSHDFRSVLSPGLHVSLTLGNSPLDVLVSSQFVPSLREEGSSGTLDALQFGISLTRRIPFISL